MLPLALTDLFPSADLTFKCLSYVLILLHPALILTVVSLSVLIYLIGEFPTFYVMPPLP